MSSRRFAYWEQERNSFFQVYYLVVYFIIIFAKTKYENISCHCHLLQTAIASVAVNSQPAHQYPLWSLSNLIATLQLQFRVTSESPPWLPTTLSIEIISSAWPGPCQPLQFSSHLTSSGDREHSEFQFPKLPEALRLPSSLLRFFFAPLPGSASFFRSQFNFHWESPP